MINVVYIIGAFVLYLGAVWVMANWKRYLETLNKDDYHLEIGKAPDPRLYEMLYNTREAEMTQCSHCLHLYMREDKYAGGACVVCKSLVLSIPEKGIWDCQRKLWWMEKK
jgi:ferredoxin